MITIFALSVLRSLCIALFTTFAAQHIYNLYSSSHGTFKKALLILIIIPLLVPPLLPAYAYSAFKINFQTLPIINEIFYGLITTARFMPYCVLAYYLLNFSKTNSANLCDSLSPGKKLSLYKKHSIHICIYSITFLLCLHEYETASLMRIKQWSIEVFNAHSGGLSQTMISSLKMIMFPLLLSIIVLATAFTTLSFSKVNSSLNTIGKNEAGKLSASLLIILIFSALIIPLAIVTYSGIVGFGEIFSSGWMLRETTNSIIFALVATICLAFFSQAILNMSSRFIYICLLPGLCGNLILGLIILNLFQFPGLSSLNRTVIPLTLALICTGLPFSLLFNFAFSQKFKNSSLTTASLLPENEHSTILWKLKTVPFILSQFPVFCLLWFDLTLNTLLAPTSMPGIFPRLYNLMHYNENEKLSATVVVAVLIPPIILALILVISRLGVKWTQRRLSGS